MQKVPVIVSITILYDEIPHLDRIISKNRTMIAFYLLRKSSEMIFEISTQIDYIIQLPDHKQKSGNLVRVDDFGSQQLV